MRKSIILALVALSAAMTPAAFAAGPNVMDIKTSITDDAIIFPESFESDTQKLLEGWYMRNYTSADVTTTKADVQTSDDEIRRRLAAMPTVMEMPFNSIVRQYIDRYTKGSRPQISAILGLGLYYMPIFEQALEERGLPQELKYLPVIESALDPNAVSKHGATGLWQLMLATGKGLGLECNSLVDERRDPYASSQAAAELLKQLYDTYGDWSLAIAAYNSGPSAVNKAIRRSGLDTSKADFWSIYEYLTPETRGYVPMFIAANYVMTYYPKHDIAPVLPTKPLVTDTVGVSERIHFDQISAVLGIPVDELRILNPQYREDVIPGTPDRAYMLALPSKQVHAYLMSHGQILAYEAEKYGHRDQVEPGIPSALADNLVASEPSEISGQSENSENSEISTTSQPQNSTTSQLTSVSHKVSKGETLASIAEKYGVQASEIRTANNLRRNAVRVGQLLTINNVDPSKADAAQSDLSDKSDKSDLSDKSDKSDNTTQAASAPQSSKSSVAKKETAKKEAAKKETTKKKVAAKPTTHQIKSGDNLGAIARKYGVTVDEIKKANGMKNDNIRAGDSLTIPAKGSSSKSSSKSKKKRR